MTVEINTYSSAVDDIVNRSGRPERRSDILSYVRTTIRECQALAFFKNDMVEDSLTAAAAPYVWTYPQEFRILRTVRYNILNNRGEYLYPPEIKPGRKQQGETYFYYGGPGYYVFSGVAVGTIVNVAYYSNLKKLPYYASGSRPAVFDLETDAWTYLSASTDAEKETARNLVSNWLLFNYYDTILEGALAKVFKSIGDERAVSTYALYKQLQNTLLATEPKDSMGA